MLAPHVYVLFWSERKEKTNRTWILFSIVPRYAESSHTVRGELGEGKFAAFVASQPRWTQEKNLAMTSNRLNSLKKLTATIKRLDDDGAVQHTGVFIADPAA